MLGFEVGHLQPVRAFLEIGDQQQRKVWMEHLDGVATQHTKDFGDCGHIKYMKYT